MLWLLNGSSKRSTKGDFHSQQQVAELPSLMLFSIIKVQVGIIFYYRVNAQCVAASRFLLHFSTTLNYVQV